MKHAILHHISIDHEVCNACPKTTLPNRMVPKSDVDATQLDERFCHKWMNLCNNNHMTTDWLDNIKRWVYSPLCSHFTLQVLNTSNCPCHFEVIDCLLLWFKATEQTSNIWITEEQHSLFSTTNYQCLINLMNQVSFEWEKNFPSVGFVNDALLFLITMIYCALCTYLTLPMKGFNFPFAIAFICL